MDYALTIIEDSFGVDFKFFNTYGPSKRFIIYPIEVLLVAIYQ